MKKIPFDKIYKEFLFKEKQDYIYFPNDTQIIFRNIRIKTLIIDLDKDILIINENEINRNEMMRRDDSTIYRNLQFSDCIIGKIEVKSLNEIDIDFRMCEIEELVINGITSKKDNANNCLQFLSSKITKIFIKNSKIDFSFVLNHDLNAEDKIKINSIHIENVVFKKDFLIYKHDVQDIKIVDTHFESQAEFEDIIFNTNEFKNVIFLDLISFDKSIFKEKVKFMYIKLKSIAYFRYAEFQDGLDLDTSSMEQDVNFYGIKGLDSKESKKNTSQETYRIIKHQFEKIGNKIEANKYHALELKQLRNNTSWYTPNYIVQLFHLISSNNSQWWILPLFWICIIGILTNLFSGEPISYNNFFMFSSILTKIDGFCGNYVLMTFNKLLLGYLYYQFLMSVRKDTRK